MIACLSLNQENYQPLAKLTLGENRMSYCEEHGYLPVFREYPDMPDAVVPEIHKFLGFEKIKMFLDIFQEHPNCDAAWFLDCDAMVTNMTVKLEDLFAKYGKGIVTSSDCRGMNPGSLWVTNGSQERVALRMILEMANTQPYEGEAIHVLKGQNIFHEDFIRIAPQRESNSYEYSHYTDAEEKYGHLFEQGQWKKGDFVIHWPGRTLEQRLAHYREYEKEVVG